MASNNLVIIGNGIAGITTALEYRKLNPESKITVISGESQYFYSRTALMYIFMGHMEFENTIPYPPDFWKKQKIDLVFDWVEKVDTNSKILKLKNTDNIFYDKLVLATGSISNKFGWPGQDLDGVQGLYSLQDLELLEKNVLNAKKAIIVGGGLIGIELAEMLHSRGIHVTFLIRENLYWNSVLPDEESKLVVHAIKSEHFDLIRKTNLKEIVDNGNGRVSGIITEFDQKIECDFVGLTPGVSPNVSIAKDSNLPIKKGYLVNKYLETEITDIYACGDCAEIVKDDGTSKIWPLWYTGKMHGEVLAQTLSGNKTEFKMGVFFNSAKFLDLEYQTYGDVFRDRIGEKHHYWQSEDKNHSLRLVEKEGVLIGVNVMGIRYRHRVCEDWIKNKLTIKKVLTLLEDANFDPEFSKKFEPEIINKFRGAL